MTTNADRARVRRKRLRGRDQLTFSAASVQESGLDPARLAPHGDQVRAAGTQSAAAYEDRLGMVWLARWWVLAIVVVITLLTYIVSTSLPGSYASSATVSVSAQGSSTVSPLDTVDASNGLASQVAQLVTTDAIEGPAKKALGRSNLAGSVAAATAADQNLIVITVTGRNGPLDRAEADALAASTKTYVVQTSANAAEAHTTAVTASLASLGAAITQANTAVHAATIAAAGALAGSPAAQTLANAETALQNLQLRQQTLQSQAAVDGASQEPSVSIVAPAGSPSKVSPKPLLYTLIAFVVGLILAVEAALIVGRRRASRPRASKHER